MPSNVYSAFEKYTQFISREYGTLSKDWSLFGLNIPKLQRLWARRKVTLLAIYLMNQSLFTTDTGYLGRAPTASNMLEQGDLLCIIYDFGALIVLRPIGEYYKVVTPISHVCTIWRKASTFMVRKDRPKHLLYIGDTGNRIVMDLGDSVANMSFVSGNKPFSQFIWALLWFSIVTLLGSLYPDGFLCRHSLKFPIQHLKASESLCSHEIIPFKKETGMVKRLVLCELQRAISTPIYHYSSLILPLVYCHL